MCDCKNNDHSESPAAKRRDVFNATVTANEDICSEHFRLLLEISGDFPPVAPGMFVQVQAGCDESAVEPRVHEWPAGESGVIANPRSELAAASALLRRPISIADCSTSAGVTTLELIHRVVGRGTAWLSELGVGSEITLIGPLGNGFTLNSGRAILVGGGVGLPPMIYLARKLREQHIDCELFVGAASSQLLPLKLQQVPTADGTPSLCAMPFADWQVPTAVTTDDGTAGMKGFVTQALQSRLDSLAGSATDDITVYTCGPDPMMKAVADICLSRSLRCQVALERKMACGMGTCQSCVCKTHADNDQGWAYKLVCTDGTVFKAEDLIW